MLLFTGGHHRFLRFRRENAAARLHELQTIHCNSYELLRYLGEQGVWLGLTCFLFLGQIYMLSIPENARLFSWGLHSAQYGTASHTDGAAPPNDVIGQVMVASLFCYLALSVGRLLAMFGFLRSLKGFPKSKASLERQILFLDKRIASKHAREAPISSNPLPLETEST